MSEQIHFSVIIPTYQGANKIGNLLQSIISQDFKSFEVLVVIDGSTDSTLQIVNHWLAPTSIPFKIISKPNTGRGSTRNAGAREANGKYLIFFDDDMVLEPTCISSFSEFHKSYPNAIAVGTQLEKTEWMKTDFQLYKAQLSRKWEGKHSLETRKYSKNNLHLTAANFSLSKSMFENLNGFDERLSDVEDFELATRAFEIGIPIYYHPFAQAWHNDLITCQSYIKRQIQYNLAYKKLAEIRPQIIGQYQQTQFKEVSLTNKMIYWPFSFHFWASWIDNEKKFIRILPTKLRYKLYDLVVWSQGKIFM
ncbi:MAG: glycosyltransferase, partial [Cytophagales bacterium]|nr:glycosyltransferase [Cytophagales bacterium]